VSPDVITDRVREALPDAQIELAGADCSFELLVVSALLEGQGPVARQRLILGLFAPELASGALHALSVRAKTPKELSQSANPNRVALGTLR
jgi:BolA protein